HRDHLAPMVCGVVDDVTELLPQRVTPDLTFDVPVLDRLREPLGRQILQEHRSLRGDGLKLLAQTVDVGKLRRREDDRRRRALPALEPDPFTPNEVRERVAYGVIAALQLSGEVGLRQ